MILPTMDMPRLGWVVVAAIAVLLIAGIATIAVVDTHYGAGHDGPTNAGRQCVFVLLGVVMSGWILRLGYHRIAQHAYLIFIVALIGLLPLLIAKKTGFTLGGLLAPRNGAYRWINLPGFGLQPSEFMKVAFLLALAWYLRYRKNYRRFTGLLLPIIVSVVPLVLILLEPDLGTVMLLLPVLFAMLFMAGAKKRHLLLIVLLGLSLAPVAWQKIHDYQKLRISSVLMQSASLRQAVIEEPQKYEFLATKRQAAEWAAGSGFQLVHSKNALGSGGVFGFGWGRGIYTHNRLLPDSHNDLIFSMIGHQWGMLGCVLVLLCYAVIVLAGVRIASATADPFGRLLAVGVVTLIITQVIINIGMSVGLMPITGMTLPFVSYGGSSLLTNFIAASLLVSVSRYRPYLLANRPFEFDPRVRVHPTEREDTVPRPTRGDGGRRSAQIPRVRPVRSGSTDR